MISLELFVALLLWFFRAVVSSLICLLIGYIGIRILTHFTMKIREFETIRGHPIATSLFVGGFFIFAGLVVHGSMVNPFFLGQSVLLGAFFNVQRFLVVILSFCVSLFLGWLFYLVFARLTPFEIDLDDVNRSPEAVGVFLFCYEVFLGLVLYASLMIPLG
jgi:hypothetical protein